ncbi:MAG TPA: ribose-phosphate diphosphokinase [Clostridiales bacterium]|nr:ribose-phosphate diphosphokinase [Clostridiales bacterium]
MRESFIIDGIRIPVGRLAIIPTRGCEDLAREINAWVVSERKNDGVAINVSEEGIDVHRDIPEDYIIYPDLVRFQTGEGKCVLNDSVRGADVFIICDVFNRNATTRFFGEDRPMSPDEHFCDLKRIIDAINGKARRMTVIMPMLYEGRQHRRTKRESQDCASALIELTSLGVENIITFDAHDPRVQNAITKHTFEDISTRHQMIKALNEYGKKEAQAHPENPLDYKIDPKKLTIISPDEGGLSRAIRYSNVLHVPLGTFYKRRDYSRTVDGKNPILEHKYLGTQEDIYQKDIVIVDDMISSGGSILETAKKLKEMGARRIFACSAFGLYTEGLANFDEAYEAGYITQVFNTNLVHVTKELLNKPWFTYVSMSKYISFIINYLNTNRSLSSIVDPDPRITKRLYEKYPEMWAEYLDAKKAQEEAEKINKNTEK